MKVKTAKYVRKPLYVEAVRVTTENFEAVAKWCMGEIAQEAEDHAQNPGGKYIKLRVHNPMSVRQTKAFVGDWILYTDKGYKIYIDKAFNASFDEVVEAKAA